MKKIIMFVVLATFTVLFSSFKTIEKSKNSPLEDLNRQVLNTIEFVEECEEVDLGFDPYFYLPSNFNAYEGMILELKDIEYIELEEE